MTKVMIVDDEPYLKELVNLMLQKEGFETETAESGSDFLDKIDTFNPDIVTLDVMMPGKDGYEVVSEVKRKLGEKAPVVLMLTSKAEEADMVKGLSVGADDYVTKPFSPSVVIAFQIV